MGAGPSLQRRQCLRYIGGVQLLATHTHTISIPSQQCLQRKSDSFVIRMTPLISSASAGA